MFAHRSRTELVFHSVLILTILFNALGPVAVFAMSSANSDEVTATSSRLGRIGSVINHSSSALRSSASLQDATPTVLPVETPTPEPPVAPTSPPDVTSTPSAIQGITQPLATNQLSALSFRLSVSPEQAAAGDEVTFTIQIINNGQAPVTGLLFSNTIPADFDNAQARFRDFNFDPQTRLLTWSSTQAGVPILAPGQTVTLTYSTRLAGVRNEVQLIDSATLTADGLAQPLLAEATLIMVTPQQRVTMLGPGGGRAVGLNGHVQVSLPQNAVNAPRGLLIQDLNDGLPPGADQPWTKFALELRVPNPEHAEILLPGSVQQDRVIPMEAMEAQFDQPVEITISFDGLTDLSTLEADKTPFLVTLDAASGTWVRMPLKGIDRETNQITAEVTHFSTWGAGIGSAFPAGGSLLTFDNSYSDLFTGRARYSLPLWAPPGRNGMAPLLALSYSSGVADGILGDIQSSWVGMGWSIDSVEIARKITNGVCGTGCGSGSYGYENKFLLLFNGTGYELIPDGTTAGRYHTKSESFLYIQLHNNNLGNNSPVATNATSEWWEVVQKDGTRWRLGWTGGSEQLAAMSGYPGAATGAWAALGYAGSATNVAVSRWRADQVTDTFGNRMTLSYFEESRVVSGTAANYDRASYLDTITYTSHTSGTPAAGYSVVFVRQSRGAYEIPGAPADWDNWDTYQLDRIEVKYGTTVVRTYDLAFKLDNYSDGGVSWQTTSLASVAVSGGATASPTVTFAYTDKDNRAPNGSSSNEWPYPRLTSVANGWGGYKTFTYENDGRPNTSWYNWRVTTIDVGDGFKANPMKTIYAYSTPCYNDPMAGWCNASNLGELIGYGQTTATTKDFNGTTTLAIAVHSFYTDQQKVGREYEVKYEDPSATILSQTNTTFTTITSGLPTGGYFTYASAVEAFLRTTSLTRISKTEYQYSGTTGNLTWVKEYDGTPSLYRQTEYEYVTNTSASVWILDTISRRTLKDAVGTVLSKQEYGYDGSLPTNGSPTVGKLTLSRLVDGTQTIDTTYIYDSYGNVTETRLFKSYGTTSTQPAGVYVSYGTVYDTSLKTYATSKTTPLIPATTIAYDYGLGVPTTVTDPNGNTTTTVYDGIGRVTSVTKPGFASPNIKYTYPTPTGSPLAVTPPFAVKTEMWDQTASVYRAGWQIMDGLGHTIQTQSPYETSGYLVLNDTSYNAQGLIDYQGLPRTLSGTGGSHFAPSWISVPHSTSLYDALGRTTSVIYPDSTQESFSYSGLRSSAIDQNNHQKVQEYDAFGRLVKVEEYTGSGTYTLYGTTTYEYDVRDLLKKVTDAAANQTTIGYNGYGWKTSMSDPDMGSWSYGYSVLGNLTSQTDARNCVTAITYDDLNRPTGKTYTGITACDNTPDVTYTYDSITGGNEGLGRRTGMTDGSGSATFFYNVLGQLTNETRTIESTNYSLSGTFDAFSRPLTQTLPSGEGLTYSYNAMGALSGLSGTNTYVSQIHYNASGQVTDQLLGNGLLQQYCYNANTLRLADLRVYSGTLQGCVTSPSSPRLRLSYTYQNNGNVSQIVDATRSETLTFTYDELDRLDTVSGPYSHNYDYNSIGNITNKNTTSYTYGDTAHKHAATALSTGESYTYDANGNMITRVEGGLTYNQTFDAENRLASVTVGGQITKFVYDGDGNLVKKIKPDLSKTIYVGGIYEVDKNSGGTVTATRTYYPVAGAFRTNKLYYVLKDHLGSASVVTDSNGVTVGEDRFYPFGETRFTTGTMNTDKLFTGQREMAGLGIYHYGARFYSPKLGRFLSADTIVPGYANPQNLNRFSYVRNNPLRYTDPTGHLVDNDDDYRCRGCTPPPPTRTTTTRTPTNPPTRTPTSTPTNTPTATQTPTNTPTATQTPVCTSPTNSCATSLAAAEVAPTVTLTTTPSVGICGTNMDCPPTPQPYLDFGVNINLNNVDWFDVGIDATTVILDGVTIFAASTGNLPLALGSEVVGDLVGTVGVVSAAYDMYENYDSSGLMNAEFGLAVNQAEGRVGGEIPIAGTVFDSINLYTDLNNPTITIQWVTP